MMMDLSRLFLMMSFSYAVLVMVVASKVGTALLRASSGSIIAGLLMNQIGTNHSTLKLSTIPTTVSDAVDYKNYDKFANNYDSLNSGTYSKAFGIDSMRSIAGEYAQGEVLEVAVGTGLQLPYYKWNQISSYIGIDNSEGMLDASKDKMKRLFVNKQYAFISSDVSNIPFDEHKFDTVIDTFSMCVFDDPSAVLTEMKRLVKPVVGRIVLLENSRSLLPIVGPFQDLTEPLITPSAKGCRWNVDVAALAKGVGGLKLQSYQSTQLGTISLSVYSREE